MRNDAEHAVESHAAEKRWAAVRIVLGWLQMVGAAASLILLWQGGTSTATVVTVTVTAVLMVISVILFRVLKLPRVDGKSSS